MQIKEGINLAKKKKVLQIEPERFLQSAGNDVVFACHHIKDALDISDWSFEQLHYVMSNLYKMGNTKVKVIEVN